MGNQGRRKQRWLAATAAAAAAGTVLLSACGGSGGNSASSAISPASGHGLAGFGGTSGSPKPLPTGTPSGMAGMSGMPSSASAAPAAAPVASDSVTIHNFAFGPQVVTVKAGTSVHWANGDGEAHTVTSDTGTFGSPVLQPGTGYSHTFTKPGTYRYHCTIHPFMTGTVVVS